MKTIIVILLSNLMITLATAQQTKTYYDNGQLKEVGSYDKNGKKTSEWKYYYNNGHLLEIGNFKVGKRTGYWIFYGENGKLINADNYSKK